MVDPTAPEPSATAPADAEPVNADNSGMTRQELLQAAADNYLEWARTATTDEPPEGFNRQFARSDAYFAAVLRERNAERAATADGAAEPVEAAAEPAVPASVEEPPAPEATPPT